MSKPDERLLTKEEQADVIQEVALVVVQAYVAKCDAECQARIEKIFEWIEQYQRGGGYYQFETEQWQAFKQSQALKKREV